MALLCWVGQILRWVGIVPVTLIVYIVLAHRCAYDIWQDQCKRSRREGIWAILKKQCSASLDVTDYQIKVQTALGQGSCVLAAIFAAIGVTVCSSDPAKIDKSSVRWELTFFIAMALFMGVSSARYNRCISHQPVHQLTKLT